MSDVQESTVDRCGESMNRRAFLKTPALARTPSKATGQPGQVAIVDEEGYSGDHYACRNEPNSLTIMENLGHEISVDVQAASRVADEKRQRNAGASARFRERQMEKKRLEEERLATMDTSRLEQPLHDAAEDKDPLIPSLYYQTKGIDWSFLQHQLPTVSIPPSDACPSLATSSTLSSRNSSTRSARSYDEDGSKQRCPMPECGNTIFTDFKAHMLIHNRPEKCPIDTCDYHNEGFALSDHMVRHVCTWHFSGTLLCGFCTRTHSAFKRHEVFTKHLADVHGIELISDERRRDLYSVGTTNPTRCVTKDRPIATCNLCSEPFDPQGMYEHLFGCIFRHVTEHASDHSPRDMSTRSYSRRVVFVERPLSSSEDETFSKPAIRRRRELNRAAQRAFRERKEQHIEKLEARVFALQKASSETSGQNETLREHLDLVQSDNERLQSTRLQRTRNIQNMRAEALLALEGVPRPSSTGAGPIDAKSDTGIQFPSDLPAMLAQRHRLRPCASSESPGRMQGQESPSVDLTDVKPAMLEVSRRLSKHEHEFQQLESSTTGIDELTASSRCLSLTSTSSNEVKTSDEETEWTEEACPSSPQSDTDAIRVHPMLSPIKHQLVDRIMEDFHRLFDHRPLSRPTQRQSAQVTTCAGGSNSNTTYRASSSFSSGSSQGNSPSMSRKRSLSGGGQRRPGDDGDDGEDPNKRRRSESKSGGKEAILELRFACPYYKRNPGRHQTFTSCRDPGFNTVARLKEHLYRRHLLPIQCNRCCSTFPNEPALREHQRDPRGCEVREQVPLEGFDKGQERKLKSKKRSLVFQSEEDKWNAVYKVLFPDDNEADMPSPYIEYQPPGAPNLSSETSNVARFHEFSRLELPRLVRRTLEVVVEQEAQPLEEKLKERLVDIVKECQTQLLTMFQGVSGSEEEAVAGSSELEVHVSQSQAHSNLAPPTQASDFYDFSSFIQLPTEPIEPSRPALYPIPEADNIPKDTTYPSSDSPDSGYGSTWTGINSFNHNSSLDASLYNDNTYPELNRYYELFDGQPLASNQEYNFGQEDSSWSFVDGSSYSNSYGQEGNGGAEALLPPTTAPFQRHFVS